MMTCWTWCADCSIKRRSRWDLPEPELPCTSSRVASNSSRCSVTAIFDVVVPRTISVMRGTLLMRLPRGNRIWRRSPNSGGGFSHFVAESTTLVEKTGSTPSFLPLARCMQLLCTRSSCCGEVSNNDQDQMARLRGDDRPDRRRAGLRRDVARRDGDRLSEQSDLAVRALEIA